MATLTTCASLPCRITRRLPPRCRRAGRRPRRSTTTAGNGQRRCWTQRYCWQHHGCRRRFNRRMRRAVADQMPLDPLQATGTLDSSTQQFRHTLAPFLVYLIDNRFSPRFAPECDDRFVAFKNDRRITRAAAEAWRPSWNTFPWSHAVLGSWSTTWSPGPSRLLELKVCCRVPRNCKFLQFVFCDHWPGRKSAARTSS